MARPLLSHGEVAAEFTVDAGSCIVVAEVTGSMPDGEEWTIEMADANKSDSDRVWTPVHNTGTTAGRFDAFNGIMNTNLSVDFFTSTGNPAMGGGYVYRIRKTGAGTGENVMTNTNIAFTYDIGSVRIWR